MGKDSLWLPRQAIGKIEILAENCSSALHSRQILAQSAEGTAPRAYALMAPFVAVHVGCSAASINPQDPGETEDRLTEPDSSAFQILLYPAEDRLVPALA